MSDKIIELYQDKAMYAALCLSALDDYHQRINWRSAIAKFNELGWDKLPICMAKTQMSLSDDGKVMGRPTGFRITVRELRPSLGAGFIVALTGKVLTMPGLPKAPAAEGIDVDEEGRITGLF